MPMTFRYTPITVKSKQGDLETRYGGYCLLNHLYNYLQYIEVQLIFSLHQQKRRIINAFYTYGLLGLAWIGLDEMMNRAAL